ncbi:hypothetical protein MRB53_006289 [Persea americana]|uniref:Uncharacterized protein n=1 Tax=Persea americana TaxID=3435 RepID=A0ACC2MGR7_PERAE|nr:hypothetical protein MRB53_006289 [Persea americana]
MLRWCDGCDSAVRWSGKSPLHPAWPEKKRPRGSHFQCEEPSFLSAKKPCEETAGGGIAEIPGFVIAAAHLPL